MLNTALPGGVKNVRLNLGNNETGNERTNFNVVLEKPPDEGSDSDDSLYSGHRDSGVVSEHQSENIPSYSDIVPEVFERKEIIPKEEKLIAQKDSRLERFKAEKQKEDAKKATIRQHYYPEGGWGWAIVIATFISQFLVEGVTVLVGLLLFCHLPPKLDKNRSPELKALLGSLSLAVPLLLSPLTIALCRRKSTRLAAVLGGLIAALGCLFSSFASQFLQLFLSYGIIFGTGVGLTRDTATLMVGQYFKRRREMVEIILMSGSGVGIAAMSAIVQGTLSTIGWRFGLQVVTCLILLSSLFGCCYRSASLYHPQRRAILHLKNQRRKIKDKTKIEEKPPLLDFSTLRSKTVRILLVSTAISYWGILAPLVLLVHEIERTSHSSMQLLTIHFLMGSAWVLGCFATGLLIIKKPKNFQIGRQYITQISGMAAGVAIISLGSHEGASADSFFMFSFVYGFSMGAYSYALKLYVYEKVRARNFSRAWSFVQFAQGLPLMIGIPLSGFLNEYCSPLSGFYVSGSAVCIGSMCMFFIDVRKYLIRKKNKKIHRHKHHHIKGSESTHSRLKFAGTDSETQTGGEEGFEDGRCTPSCKESIRRDSFADEDDLMAPLAIINQTSLAALGGQFGDPLVPELTCISEEGIADMDIPEHLFDEFDFEMNIDPDDEISSCDKVENCLVLSEYENNLKKHKETAQITNEKRGRRWSIFKLGQKTDHRLYRHSSVRNGSLKMTHPYNQRREIDVIEEASI